MRSLLVFAVFVASVFSCNTTCPDWYTDGGSGKCYRTYTISQVTQELASAYCRSEGAVLATIPNVFVNNALRSNDGFTWFGLTCPTKNSCQYAEKFKPTSYTNFYPGQPSYGTCVYMSTNGFWFSHACDSLRLNRFVCEIDGSSGNSTVTTTAPEVTTKAAQQNV